MLFKKGQTIDKYEVLFPCESTTYAETYRVRDDNGNILFLKIISLAKLDASQYSQEGKVLEIEIAHKLILEKSFGYVNTGMLIDKGQQYAYVVQEFISGESVADRMGRDSTISVYEAKRIAMSVLSQLSILYSFDTPIIYNGVSPRNIMLDMTTEPANIKLVSLSHARFLSMSPRRGLTDVPFYQAPERFNGVCSVQTDLYAVGALLYHMIFGVQPWFIDLSCFKKEEQIAALLQKRQRPLLVPNMYSTPHFSTGFNFV